MKNNGKTTDEIVSRWQAKRLFKARPIDLVMITSLFFAGLLAVWSGQMMGFHMTPGGAVSTSRMLDELELPRQLPNKPVVSEDGQVYQLWELLTSERTLLSVYAPWCPGCQKEILALVKSLSEKGKLVVLVSRDEDFSKVRNQLENLGLADLVVYRDMTGHILAKGKVTKLPTTFLLKEYGKVMDRLVGFSEYKLRRLTDKAQTKK